MSIIHVNRMAKFLRTRFETLLDLTDLPAPPNDLREDHILSRSLAAFMIGELANLDDQAAANAVVDNHKDNGIDAFHFSEKEHLCYLVQSKWNKTGKKGVQLDDTIKFCKGVSDLLGNRFDR